MDSRLKGISIESKNTQIQVLMKELCMFQIGGENQHTAVIAAAGPFIFFIFGWDMTSIFIKLYMGGL